MYVYIYTLRITSNAEFEWKHWRSLLLVIIEPCDRKDCLFRKTGKFTPPHPLTHSVLARNLYHFMVKKSEMQKQMTCLEMAVVKWF